MDTKQDSSFYHLMDLICRISIIIIFIVFSRISIILWLFSGLILISYYIVLYIIGKKKFNNEGFHFLVATNGIIYSLFLIFILFIFAIFAGINFIDNKGDIISKKIFPIFKNYEEYSSTIFNDKKQEINKIKNICDNVKEIKEINPKTNLYKITCKEKINNDKIKNIPSTIKILSKNDNSVFVIFKNKYNFLKNKLIFYLINISNILYNIIGLFLLGLFIMFVITEY